MVLLQVRAYPDVRINRTVLHVHDQKRGARQLQRELRKRKRPFPQSLSPVGREAARECVGPQGSAHRLLLRHPRIVDPREESDAIELQVVDGGGLE